MTRGGPWISGHKGAHSEVTPVTSTEVPVLSQVTPLVAPRRSRKGPSGPSPQSPLTLPRRHRSYFFNGYLFFYIGQYAGHRGAAPGAPAILPGWLEHRDLSRELCAPERPTSFRKCSWSLTDTDTEPRLPAVPQSPGPPCSPRKLLLGAWAGREGASDREASPLPPLLFEAPGPGVTQAVRCPGPSPRS